MIKELPNKTPKRDPPEKRGGPLGLSLGMQMNLLLAFFLILSSSWVFAASPPNDESIAEREKHKLLQVFRGALKDKFITQQQFDKAVYWLNSTPCNGVDRNLSEARKKELAIVIAKQEGLENVNVLKAFKVDDWNIVYVETYVSDEPYLFYSTDPITAKKSVTSWSGAAMVFETAEIREWVLENALGIPERLASCFAWHVTLSRH